MKKKVHVIHHTHWDFEWYFTNNESFVQLTYHLDEVMTALEENKIDQYLLDGQMSILDEYLQSFPEQKERLRQLVTAGKLKIGPWYTQTDELIVRGESIVRNLQIGMELAEELGGAMKIGYLPDSFGQSKDMPKIYNGFGIDQAVFWRGVPNDVTTKREFYWQAEDGSQVLASNIKNGYFVGVGLIYTDDYQELMATIEEGATGSDLVLPVGGDQRYVDFNLRERIQQYNQALPDAELVESSYEDFFTAVEQNELPTVAGEFISSSVSKIHRSIYSSRYDHKYLNDKIERRMIYQLEPLMVMAESYGIAYKQGILDRIWKLLNKNQAHDSAGGCNSDKTNQIILDRFIEADQLSYSLVDYLTRKIAESRAGAANDDVVIFNTVPWPMKKVMRCELSTTYEHFVIEKDGQPVPFDLLETKKEYAGSIRRLEKDMDPEQFYFIHQIALEVELPSLSFETYQVVEAPSSVAETQSEKCWIENDYYQLFFEAGQLSLVTKGDHQSYENILSFEDSGDEGDTYDYSPPYEDDQYVLSLENADCQIAAGPLLSEFKITGTWQIAKDLTERKNKQRTQAMDYQLVISLKKGSRQIECHLEMQNNACDHRMRVLIHTPHQNEFSYTDTPFGTIKREVEDRHIKDWQELGWREEPTTIFPMLSYVNSHNETSSWTVFTKGIKEYQFVGKEFGTMALTLFRSVGFLGRPDLIRRPGVASGNEFKYIPTPDSQLQKKMTFKFSLQLDQDYCPAMLAKDYLAYALACPFYQLQEMNRFTSTLKYFVSNPLPEKVVPKEQFTLVSEKLVLSSLAKSRDGKGLDIRVFNPSTTEEAADGYILTPAEMSYTFADLKGTPILSVEKNDKIAIGTVKPGEIKTIRIVN